MLSTEAKSLIHLHLIYGVGNHTIRRLLAAFTSAEKAIAATPEELAQVEGLTPAFQQRPFQGRTRVSLERELELIQTHGCRIVTINDESYPALLKQISDPPLVLYVKGDLPAPETPYIAIVGSRSPTDYGRTTCRKLSKQLAMRGFSVVSGFARGIDTCAHRGALDAGGRTIAVMGNGLSIIYPESNRAIADEIVQSGALISEFPMTMPPKGTNFPRRNRVISGLSLGTLVVEASKRSGSLITARCAAEQGREVFAVPGPIFSKMSQGTHYLINQGATLAHSVEDLLDALPAVQPEVKISQPSPTAQPVFPLNKGGSTEESRREKPPQNGGYAPPTAGVRNEAPTRRQTAAPSARMGKPAAQPQSKPADRPAAVELTPDEQTIFSALGDSTSHIDEIVRATRLPIAKVSALLVMLELKGVIQQLPGKLFTRAEKT